MPWGEFVRTYWRSLLIRQIVLWIVMGGIVFVFARDQWAASWLAILIGGLFFNFLWTFVA